MTTRTDNTSKAKSAADLDLNPETVKDLEPPKHGPSVRGGRSSGGGSGTI